METKWHPAMKSAISEVLETMFFVPVEFSEDKADTLPLYYGSRISLTRDNQRIDISFRVTDSFVRMIAANFLGADENEVGEAELADVMRELANMVGGDFMPRMDSEGWQLGIPSFKRSEGGNGKPAADLSLWCFGEFVGVVLFQPDL